MTARGVSGWVATGIIARREVMHVLRRPARVAAAVGTPLLLWLLLASGFAASLQPAHTHELGYTPYLLPGMMTLVAVFAAVFASISLIDERQTGWLQSVLVSPAPRWSVAAGKTAGGSVVALAEAILLLPAAAVLGLPLGPLAAAQVIAALAVTCIAMSALGVAFAWRSETTAGFHAVMNLIFLPMWVLSGAFFPVTGAAGWLAWLMRMNPLTWCTQAIRGPLTDGPWLMPMLPAIVFAALMVAWAILRVRERR